MAKREKQETTEAIPTIDPFENARRNLSGQVQIVVDTFKLEPATAKKNVGFGNKPSYVDMEHCHIFHTYDSNGRVLKGTNQVGGHYHEITVTVDEKTGNLVGKCSPPMQNLKSEAIAPFKHDTHTHEVKYIKSEKVQLRKMNALAQQYAANFMKPDQAKLSGLSGERVD